MALPSGPLEIVFSFDTTGSMSSYLAEVRGRVSDMVQRLQADIPCIRLAIFAHADYCNSDDYVTKYVDFTDDVKQLCDFVDETGSRCTNGGDLDECYELVLYEVRTKLSWTPGSQRALVMIGDCNPHGPYNPMNTLRLDWRKEADSLRDIGVRIYGVQCGGSSSSEKFYKTISQKTGGSYLQLSGFKQVFDFLMAVCYNEKGPDMVQMYENEVRARHEPVHRDLDKLFGDLRDGATSSSDDTCAVTSTSVSKPVPLKPKLTKPSSITALKPAAIGGVKKYQKRRVAAKRVKTAKDCLASYRLQNLPRHRREEVPEKNFMLGGLAWSQWQLALASKPKAECCQKRKAGKAGYRAETIFGGHTHKPALYEVAVQPKFRCRKFVVLNKCSHKGFKCGLNWERKLFGRKGVTEQLESVLKKCCDVFVRRAELRDSRHREAARQSTRRYDYAWSVIKAERNGHRPVTKANVDISEEMEI